MNLTIICPHGNQRWSGPIRVPKPDIATAIDRKPRRCNRDEVPVYDFAELPDVLRIGATRWYTTCSETRLGWSWPETTARVALEVPPPWGLFLGPSEPVLASLGDLQGQVAKGWMASKMAGGAEAGGASGAY